MSEVKIHICFAARSQRFLIRVTMLWVDEVNGNGTADLTGLTSIENFALTRCNLKSVVLDPATYRIGKEAFSYITALTSLTLPSSISVIEESAYMATHLSSVQLNNGLRSIGKYAFIAWKCTFIYIPSSVHGIGVHSRGMLLYSFNRLTQKEEDTMPYPKLLIPYPTLLRIVKAISKNKNDLH